MNDEHKIIQLEKALYILLEACDWDDVQEVGGEPLEKAIVNANEVLKYVEVDSESVETWKCSQCGTDCSAIQCPADSGDDDLIEETDYLEEDDE